MWYRNADKSRPPYELKIIGKDAEYAIKKLLYLQGNYNPSDIEVSRKIKKLLEHLETKYGSIANVRLFTKNNTLQELVSQNVYELFGKASNK